MPDTYKEEIHELQSRCTSLKRELTALDPIWKGSLNEVYRKCGKPNCHCAKPDSQGHGPSWQLTYKRANSKTTTVQIPIEDIEQTRRQVDEYKKFRALCQELVEVNQRLCQAHLLRRKTNKDGTPAEKRGSKKRSPRKLRRKSRR